MRTCSRLGNSAPPGAGTLPSNAFRRAGYCAAKRRNVALRATDPGTTSPTKSLGSREDRGRACAAITLAAADDSRAAACDTPTIAPATPDPSSSRG